MDKNFIIKGNTISSVMNKSQTSFTVTASLEYDGSPGLFLITSLAFCLPTTGGS